MNGVSTLTVTEQVSLVYFEQLEADGASLSALLETLAKERVNIDMISQCSAPSAPGVSISFTIADADLVTTLRVCHELSRQHPGLKPLVSSSNCKVQLYGAEMPHSPGVAAAAVAALCQSGVPLQLITTSEVDISCLVSRMDFDATVTALNETFSL